VITLRRDANVARLALQAQLVREDLRPGDSLATNGVCLTVERIEPAALWLTMMPETLRRTTLGTLTAVIASTWNARCAPTAGWAGIFLPGMSMASLLSRASPGWEKSGYTPLPCQASWRASSPRRGLSP